MDPPGAERGHDGQSMRIGLTFDAKEDGSAPPGAPDDWQEEFDSPATLAALAGTIESLGHTVDRLGNGPALVHSLISNPPDLVFNIAEGRGTSRSREARVPAICETLGIPCTGSDPATLSVAMDKGWTRCLVAERGVVVPRGRTVSDPDDSLDDLPLPAVVKPAWEGSSKGIRSTSLVSHRDELRARVAEMLAAYRQPVLVEEFIDGEEVTVAAIGNAPWWMGAMRVLPRKASGPFIYSLEVKRDWENQVSYEAPAALGDAATRALFSAAENILRILEVRDVGRMDFRVRGGVPYFLEINPLPGLDPRTGDLCILAKGHGLDHAGVIGRILRAAATRHGLGA